MTKSVLPIAVLLSIAVMASAVMAQDPIPNKNPLPQGYTPSGTPIISYGRYGGDNYLPGWAQSGWSEGKEQGGIRGYEDGTDRPNATPTRAEAWTMSVRAAEQAMENALRGMLPLLLLSLLLLFVSFVLILLMLSRLARMRQLAQPPAPIINLTLSLPNGLFTGPLLSNIRADAFAEGGNGGEANSSAASEAAGTANLANGEGAEAGTRRTSIRREEYLIETNNSTAGMNSPILPGADSAGNPV